MIYISAKFSFPGSNSSFLMVMKPDPKNIDFGWPCCVL